MIALLIAPLIALCILLLVADPEINVLVLVTWQLGLENEFVVLEVEDVEAAAARVGYQVLGVVVGHFARYVPGQVGDGHALLVVKLIRKGKLLVLLGFHQCTHSDVFIVFN